MAITAADIRAKATSGLMVSTGTYKQGSTSPVGIYLKDNAVFWTSGMSIDCDGQPGSKCNKTADPYFQPETAWQQSNGQPLKAETLPFVVVPLPSPTWDFRKSGIRGGDLCVMVYRDRIVYGVVGDQGPSARIGEASYAAASALGINPDPVRGGIGSGVTYVVFPGVRVAPIESTAEAQRIGQATMAGWLGLDPEPEPEPEPHPEPTPKTRQYLVDNDDTVESVLRDFDMTWEELASWNRLITPGQVILVKAPDEPVFVDPYASGLPRINSQSPSAIALQKELKSVGYMDNSVVEHPNYGPKTQAAVLMFHREHPEFGGENPTMNAQISKEGWKFLQDMPTGSAQKTAVAAAATTVVESPVPGFEVTYPYGVRNAAYAAGYHTGEDYAATLGRAVVAVRDGVIAWANHDGGAYGNWIGLRADNDRDYVYCHLDSFHVSVRQGMPVKAGQIIGYVGSTGNSTGPHLHFEDRPAGGGYGTGRKPEW